MGGWVGGWVGGWMDEQLAYKAQEHIYVQSTLMKIARVAGNYIHDVIQTNKYY